MSRETLSRGVRFGGTAVFGLVILLCLTGVLPGNGLSTISPGPASQRGLVVSTLSHSASTDLQPVDMAAVAARLGYGPHPRSLPIIGQSKHPDPVPVVPPPSYDGHYYAGAVYNGTTTTATEVQVRITVPDDYPQSSDFYYVILSIWDNAGSYDQVGFTNDNGVWGLAYSSTSFCAGTYYYSPDAISLQRGQTYTFAMSISSGTVTFAAFNSTGSAVWSLDQTTGGTSFDVAAFYSCDSTSFYDYTDYEEVYDTADPLPPYEFPFTSNQMGSAAETNWASFTSDAPGTIYRSFSGANVFVDNEPYELNFTYRQDWIHFGTNSSAENVTTALTVTLLDPDGHALGLSTDSLPAGWSFTAFPDTGSGTFSSSGTVTIPGGTAIGTYTVEIDASDGTGNYSREALNVTLVDTPVPLISAAPSSGHSDVGQTVQFTATASGGVSPYSYSWTQVPPGCANSGTAIMTCAITENGTFDATVEVTDSHGATGTTTYLMSVDSDPSVGEPLAAPTAIDLGQSTNLTAFPTGGSGEYSFVWTGLPAGCSSMSLPVLPCDPSSVGTSTVKVQVTDSNGFVATSTGRIVVVDPDPVLGGPAENRSSVDVTQKVGFSATASGGSGIYSFTWFGLPPGCTSVNLSALDCEPTEPGSYTISLTLQDSHGYIIRSSTLGLVVSSLPSVSLTVDPENATRGALLTLNATVAGGAGIVAYAWSGLPAGCHAANSSALPCVPTSGGTFTVKLVVTDGNGALAVGTLVIHIKGSSSGAGGIPETGILTLGLVIAAAIIGAVILAARRRRPRPPIRIPRA